MLSGMRNHPLKKRPSEINLQKSQLSSAGDLSPSVKSGANLCLRESRHQVGYWHGMHLIKFSTLSASQNEKPFHPNANLRAKNRIFFAEFQYFATLTLTRQSRIFPLPCHQLFVRSFSLFRRPLCHSRKARRVAADKLLSVGCFLK